MYNLRMYGHTPLLMGIYNNYSGYYKVRQRIYVSEPFDKLNLSDKNIKKWAWQSTETWSNAWKYDVKPQVAQA